MGDGGDGSFGGALRRRREAAGLTQEALAERAGLSTSAVSALERGDRRRPYPHTVRALADALGLDEAGRSALAAAATPNAAGDDDRPAAATGVAALPIPATPLVGREADVAVVAGLLCPSDPRSVIPPRLVTLLGPGGVGKTRLALAVAAAAAGSFPGGVVFVPLAPLADPALVVPAIAGAFGVREAGAVPLADTLRAALRARPALLLVLDNCEHLLSAAPDIAALLAACPPLTVLATSRAPLRLSGEQEWAVAPLATPALDHVPTPAEVAAAPAAALFLARAQAASPGFALTDANAAAVAAICRRLDGLPLAIELAAAWIKLLPPTALLARLDDALPLLAGGARDLPARQRTMRDAVAWSHDLLDPGERALFRRLAPFAGGWTVAAAAAVALDGAFAGDRSPELAALEGLAGLLDKSLIARPPALPDDEAEPRYAMLETIRAYASERLAEAGEDAAARTRHAEHFLALAERAAPELFRADQREWLDRLGRDRDNLRAALGWTLGRGDAERVARLGTALAQFWAVRGPLEEGRRWLERALVPGAGLDARVEARARHALTRVDIAQARFASAAAQAAAALPLAREVGDRETEADVLGVLGFTAAVCDGDAAGSAARFAEALALHRDLDQGWAVGSTLFGMAMAVLRLGDLQRAAALLPEAEATLRAHGSWWYLSGCLFTGAQLALAGGDGAHAAALCREAIDLSLRLAETVALAFGLGGLGAALALEGQFARAARLFGAAEALHERNGSAIEVMANRDVHEAQVARAREGLGADAFAAAWAAGRALSLEEAVVEALADGGDGPSGAG